MKSHCHKLIALFTFPLFSFSQTGPGGVSTNLSLWIKADLGPNCTTNGCNPTLWTDQSLSGNNANAIGLNSPVYTAVDMNYNPSIELNLNDGSGWATSITTIESFSFVTRLDAPSTASWSNLLGNNNSLGPREDVLTKEWGSSNYKTFAVGPIYLTPDYSINGSIGSNPISTVLHVPHIITSNNVGAVGANSLTEGFSIGTDIQNNQRTWFTAELISFSATNTALDILKINSYLAIKYGVTLDNSGGGTSGDYIASDGATIFWDASNGSAFHNDVIAIGRDDNSVLVQKQSHQMDDLAKIYVSTLQASNIANTGAFPSDISFVSMGHNGGQLCNTLLSNTEIPISTCGGSPVSTRIEREWKVTNSNFSSTFSLDWTLDPCSDLSNISAAHLRLLIDDDGDFTNATCASATISFSGSVVTISNISTSELPINSTLYFTLASIDASTPLPIELINFEAVLANNDRVDLSWQTASENNNDFFNVEYSSNGNDWEEVDTIDGAGNSSALISYQSTHRNPYQGISYYRIKQTNFDGIHSYSQIESINITDEGHSELEVFPNPAISQITIIGENTKLKQIKVYTMLGQDVTEYTKQLSCKDSKLIIDLSNLSEGMYYLKTKTSVNKVYKQR